MGVIQFEVKKHKFKFLQAGVHVYARSLNSSCGWHSGPSFAF